MYWHLYEQFEVLRLHLKEPDHMCIGSYLIMLSWSPCLKFLLHCFLLMVIEDLQADKTLQTISTWPLKIQYVNIEILKCVIYIADWKLRKKVLEYRFFFLITDCDSVLKTSSSSWFNDLATYSWPYIFSLHVYLVYDLRHVYSLVAVCILLLDLSMFSPPIHGTGCISFKEPLWCKDKLLCFHPR